MVVKNITKIEVNLFFAHKLFVNVLIDSLWLI